MAEVRPFLMPKFRAHLHLLMVGTSVPESQNSKEPSVAVVLRNQDTALATLADSAAGTFLLLYDLRVIKLTEI